MIRRIGRAVPSLLVINDVFRIFVIVIVIVVGQMFDPIGAVAFMSHPLLQLLDARS